MEPSPPQVGHAPKGELNEKDRGFSSSKDSSQSGQAFFSENTKDVFFFSTGETPVVPVPPICSTSMIPLPVLSPSSTESVRRVVN